MTENKMSNYKCELCDYKTNKKYNLTRHTDIKHMQINVTLPQKNVTFPQKNVTFPQKNVTLPQKNVTFSQNIKQSDQNTCNKCDKCEKIFCTNWYLLKHYNICKGIVTSEQCHFCNNMFASRAAKSRHLKVCKAKNTALIIKPDTETQINTGPITNNITNNNTNITNNVGAINYNIVIYNDKKTPFIKDHITHQKLKQILNSHTDETVFSRYNSQIMERVENNCIRKSDKRSNYSQIHIGENKWKNIPDKKIYPDIISQIAEDMQDVVNDEFENLKSKEKLFDLLDYLIFKETSDNNKEAERRYKRIYNLILDEQKLYAIEAAATN